MRRSARHLLLKRDGELPDFVRMKRLLQVGQLVLRRRHAADLARIDVRVGGADDDLDRRVQLADLGRGPRPVGSGRHAHVEEHDRERLVARQALLDRRHRRLRTVAEHRLETRGARRRALARGVGGILAEQPAAQLAKADHLLGHFVLEQDLPVGVAHLRLIVDDQHADRG